MTNSSSYNSTPMQDPSSTRRRNASNLTPVASTNQDGWSTSINGLLDDPSRRSNCCALTCCGIFLSDRNAHLMQTSEHLLSWKWRFIIFLLIPYALYLALKIISVLIATECDPTDVYCQQGYGQMILLINLFKNLRFKLFLVFYSDLRFMSCKFLKRCNYA